MFSTINNKKFIIIGFIASFILLVIYFIVPSIVNSFSHALEQFNQMWYWILLLVIGFGFQVGLYFYIRDSFRLKKMNSSTVVVTASSGISAGSMVACCLHYLTNVLPLLGLATAATFLSTYQLFFIIVGILSNLIGITIMLEIIQKHNLSKGFLKKILIYDINKVKKITIGSSLVVSVLFFVSIGGFFKKEIKENFQLDSESILIQEQKSQLESSETINLPAKTDTQKKVSFEVMPIDFSFDKPVRFEIKVDTHSGSLDFDLIKISILEDENGNKYQPLEWQGAVPGGHHRSGILIFPKLDSSVKIIKLIIKDNSDLASRIFEWELK